MSFDPSLFRLVQHPLKVRRLRVAAVSALTPKFRRVIFTGADLADFASLAPEDHVKVFFPVPGQVQDVAVGRDFTPRRYDAGQRTLVVDFHLHGQGPASSWAAGARPGDQLEIGGPRASRILVRSVRRHLLVGDETALPEFARRIEELPSDSHATVVALVDPGEQDYPLASTPSADVHWLERPADPARGADLLAAALSTVLADWAPDPDDQSLAWVAGEVHEVRAAMRLLLSTGAFARSNVQASGHWKRGTAGHDHHEPIDPPRPSSAEGS